MEVATEKMIAVKLVEQKGPSALVEWRERGQTRRAFVPAEYVKDGQCPKSELALGVAYGEPWEDYLPGLPTARQIVEMLHDHDIWTMDDLSKRALDVKGLLQSLYGRVFVQFMQATRGGKAK